ncbi:DNL zinc finger-domain-containing protein [Gloeopeniophorella convolvens]|nr:DNL zinc finger-domain-containing protein [Gloeopeniophorella convolvens]
MLPSRLLRNIGTVARQRPLQSRCIARIPSSLPRARLLLDTRRYSSGIPPASDSDSPSPLSTVDEPRLSLTFTCTVTDCNTRSTHQFTKRAYEKGIYTLNATSPDIALARHLIADNLGWFKESTEEGKLRNVEDLLRARGETVRRGRLNPDGSIEVNE